MLELVEDRSFLCSKPGPAPTVLCHAGALLADELNAIGGGTDGLDGLGEVTLFSAPGTLPGPQWVSLGLIRRWAPIAAVPVSTVQFSLEAVLPPPLHVPTCQ